MFTGLVEAIGRMLTRTGMEHDATIRVVSTDLDMSGIAPGDSIAVSGVCLTVTAMQDAAMRMDVSAETLTRTTLAGLQCGDEVNLETALTPTSRLGGHLVSGHVDGVGEVISREQAGTSLRLTVAAPRSLARYIAAKGSICVDGISLTVNDVEGAEFVVNVIPHTLQVTTLKHCTRGTRVNLEVDLIARYLERLLLGERAAQARAKDTITRGFLARHGFVDDHTSSDSNG